MQVKVYARPVNLNLLHEELDAQVPTFRRVTVDADGRPNADEDNGRVGLDAAGNVRVAFADDILESAIDAVVNPHNAAGRSVGHQLQDAAATRAARLQVLEAIGRAAWTPDEQAELIELLLAERT